MQRYFQNCNGVCDYCREFLAWLVYGTIENFTAVHFVFGTIGIGIGITIGEIERLTSIYIWDPPQVVILIYSMVFFKWLTGVKLDIRAGGKLDMEDAKLLTFRLLTYTFILFCANIMQKFMDVPYIDYAIVSPMVFTLLMVCLKQAADLGWVDKQAVVKIAGAINGKLGDWFEDENWKHKQDKTKQDNNEHAIK